MSSLKIEPAISEDFTEICDSDMDNSDNLDDKLNFKTNRIIPFDAAAKCGEIILEFRRKFTLVCALCPQEFDNLGSFGKHILSKHLEVDAYVEWKPFECLFLEENVSQPLPAAFNQCSSSAVNESNHSNCISSNKASPASSEKYVHEPIHEKFNHISEDRIGVPTHHDPDNFENNHIPSTQEEIPSEGKFNAHIIAAAKQNRDDSPKPLPIKYNCKICETGYRHKQSYVAHARKHHGMITKSMKKRIDAEAANLIAAIDKIRRRKQIAEARKKKMYPCPKCDLVYKTNKALIHHVGSVHGSRALKVLLRKYPCKYCGEELDGIEELNAHVDIRHTGDAKYSCRYCDRTFKTSEGQKIHTYSHTGERPYKCPHCPKRFTVAANLRVHIFMHLNIKNYSCKFCDKKFIQSTDRNIHEARHTGNKPFQCERCGKQFFTSTLLAYHRRRHQNIRIYKCNLCDKAYFTSTSLNEHMERHTGNLIYKCVTCLRSFITRKSLKQHERLHMKNKQFLCACGKAFRHSSGLNNHRKAHASIDV